MAHVWTRSRDVWRQLSGKRSSGALFVCVEGDEGLPRKQGCTDVREVLPAEFAFLLQVGGEAGIAEHVSSKKSVSLTGNRRPGAGHSGRRSRLQARRRTYSREALLCMPWT